MPEKIMIIDDERDIVFLLRDFFNLNDYEVITAFNSQEATEKLSKNPDLILLDINMPVKNGLGLAICTNLCKKLDGKINFYNNGGATVTIEI